MTPTPRRHPRAAHAWTRYTDPRGRRGRGRSARLRDAHRDRSRRRVPALSRRRPAPSRSPEHQRFAQREIPSAVPDALPAGGSAGTGCDWAILAGDREGRVRPRPRPRSVVRAGGQRQQRGRRAARCSSSPRPGRPTAWTATATGASTAGDACRCDLRRRRTTSVPRGAPGDYGRALLSYNHAGLVCDGRAGLGGALPERRGRFLAASQVSAVEAGGSAAALQEQQPNRGALHRRRHARCSIRATGTSRSCPWVCLLRVQAMLVAGNELQSLPVRPRRGIPTRAAPREEDCSSSLNYVLYQGGRATHL